MRFSRISTDSCGKSTILNLPQVSFVFNVPVEVPLLGVVAGGRAPSKQWLAAVSKDFRLWAADSGLDVCFQSEILPERIIGDFDSASEESLSWAKQNGLIPEQFPVEKDLTDLQIILRKIRYEYPVSTLLLTGCWGGRYDHMQSNVFSCLGHLQATSCICCMADENEVLLFLRGGESIGIVLDNEPEVLSLIPFSRICTGITLKGTYWELENDQLKISEPWAISNRVQKSENNTVHLEFEKGWLGIYLGWK